MSKFLDRIADVLKKSDLEFAEQVTCIAAIEMCLKHWNSALKNDIETRYGVEVRRVFQRAGDD